MSTEPDDLPTLPDADRDEIDGRIVVGVDDSEQAAAALRWALAEGAIRGTTVEVVHSWAPPLSALAVDAAARTSVDELVDAALAEMDAKPAEVLRTILPGGAATTLVEVSEGADLLVVGSHGRSGFRRMVLGSVAMACVNHASCPVVVVRVPDH